MPDSSWETLESEVAYSCSGFDIVNEFVRLPEGTETDFDYLSESESVVILPFTANGGVVVVDEWRQAVKRHNRGLPAGTLEPGEQPAEAAHRELLEETGYETPNVEQLTTVEPANGFSDAVFHYYVAKDCERTGQQRLDDDETISVETTTLSRLLDRIREGEFRDGRSAFGVVYYALFEEGEHNPYRVSRPNGE